MWTELRVAVGLSAKELVMKNKSKLDRLAYKLRSWLPVAFWLLKVANEIADLVSKAVNYYDRKFSKLYT